MININCVKAHNDYTFSGYVSESNLGEDLKDVLRIKPGVYDDEIEVSGEFSVDWDYDAPVVIIEYLALTKDGKSIHIDINDFNYNEVCDMIVDCDLHNMWLADKEVNADYDNGDDDIFSIEEL